MALSDDDIAAVAQALDEGTAYADLRRRFPALAFARCDAADVETPPLRSLGGFDLHLIDLSDHCVRVTADPAAAAGLLIARRP